MKPRTGCKTSSIGYVTIKTLPHYGEDAIPIGELRTNEQGEVEREFQLLKCQHGESRVWLKRTDI